MSLFCILTLLFIFSINMLLLLLPVSLTVYRMSLFSIMLEHTRQKLFRIQIIICPHPPMNHDSCMGAIRNWVLNWSTVFFLPSTTCRRWQIANWIYEQALWTLLHNYRKALPLVFFMKKKKQRRERDLCLIPIQSFLPGWLSEKLCHVLKTTAVL